MVEVSAGTCACIAYVFQWGYDGKHSSILSLGATSRLSGNELEDDGSSYILAILGVGRLVDLCVSWRHMQ